LLLLRRLLNISFVTVALVVSALGGLALGWLQLSQLMWPVALAYVLAALGLHLLQRSSPAEVEAAADTVASR